MRNKLIHEQYKAEQYKATRRRNSDIGYQGGKFINVQCNIHIHDYKITNQYIVKDTR